MEKCGACFVLCTTCGENCEYKQYFPRNKADVFGILRSVFGVKETLTMLRKCKPDEQAACIDSLLAEARLRILDPVRGCGGKLLKTKRKLKQAKEKIELLQKTKDSYMAEIQKVKDLYMASLQQQVASYTQVAANNRQQLPKVTASSSTSQPPAWAYPQAQPREKIGEAQKAKDSYMGEIQQMKDSYRATTNNMQLQFQQVAAQRPTTNNMQLHSQQVAAYNSQPQQTAYDVQAQQSTLATVTTAQPKPQPKPKPQSKLKPRSDYESMYI